MLIKRRRYLGLEQSNSNVLEKKKYVKIEYIYHYGQGQDQSIIFQLLGF